MARIVFRARLNDFRDYDQGDVDLLAINASAHNRRGKITQQPDELNIQSGTVSVVLMDESARTADFKEFKKDKFVKVTIESDDAFVEPVEAVEK